MRQNVWTSFALLVAVFALAHGKSVVKRQSNEIAIDPILQDEYAHEDQNRDKRHEGFIEPKFGVKNALLGFVFNPSKSVSKSDYLRFAWDKPTARPPKTTTEDIVIFEPGQKKVELDLPGELFGSGFGILTNVSTTIGDLMINSAIRTQRLLESARPLLRGIFGAKGIVIEGPTDKPIFSDPNGSS